MFVTGLEGIDNTQYFSGIAASGGWVREHETNGLLWIDDKDRANGERNTTSINVGYILMVEPAGTLSSGPAK
jgi:hypothetical protein